MLSLMGVDAHAGERLERTGFWGAIGLGAGYVQQSFEGFEETGTQFFLGFEGGYTINIHFLLGLELSGWLLQSDDIAYKTKGEGISQVFLITRYYPKKESGLFAKAGGGYVSHWRNRLGETERLSGWGLTVGAGYDFSMSKKWALTPFLTYCAGETENQDYNAFTFGIGFTFQ